MKKLRFMGIGSIALLSLGMATCSSIVPGGTLTADYAINNVTTVGFVDADGAKVEKIVVEYNFDLAGATINKDTYKIGGYAQGKTTEIPVSQAYDLKAKNVYIDNEATGDTDGKTGAGKYVIIELDTGYQLGESPKYPGNPALASVTVVVPAYQDAMMAGITQVGEFTTKEGTKVLASPIEISNYTAVQSENPGWGGAPPTIVTTNTTIPGTYTITNIADFELHYLVDDPNYDPEYPAFHADNCFDELTGLSTGVDLPYALYVPKDYNQSKQYALVLHVLDAGSLGTDPMITLTEAQANANYASEAVQNLAKAQGLGGAIVVAPQISDALRTTRDNYSMSEGVPATWQLMDYLTQKYNIDMNRIYASGQSMGGMQVVAMAAQRDNYFAAVWPIGSQWGSNNNLEVPYTDRMTGTLKYFESQDPTIWTEDADGNPIDYRNWYYLISDDNILIDNCVEDPFSSTVWKEAATLYKDVTGGKIDIKGNLYIKFSPFADKAEQNAAVKALAAKSSKDFGIIWEAYDGGSHMITWVYAHRIFANYEWLFSQTRETEMARAKLDLDKPFVRAETQLKDGDHLIYEGKDDYFLTVKAGSGTAGYNAGFYASNGGAIIRNPGWTAESIVTR